MEDKRLKEIIKKVEKIIGKNKFLTTYIEKIIWDFGNNELFVNQNKIIGFDKHNNVLRLDINDKKKLKISLSENNSEIIIEVNDNMITIQRTTNSVKKLKNNNLNKKYCFDKLHFDKTGRLKYSDSWKSVIEHYDNKSNLLSKKEQLTVYDLDKAYSYIKKNEVEFSSIIKKGEINLSDYSEFMNSDGYFYVLDLMIDDINNMNVNMKSDSIIDERLVKGKIKSLKYND